jgi:hypothetical protein
LLSAGSLAGHLIECGPQATGGLVTDWEDTKTWANPGYPIAEVSADGTCVITAPKDSDALVDVRTVGEQLLYEIGDPSRYLLPDVTCDWWQVSMEEIGLNRVRVSGAKGWAAPATLKGCAQIPDGWRALTLLFIAGRDSVAKARRVAEDLIHRGRSMLAAGGLDDFAAVDIEVLGAEDSYGSHAREETSREVVLKIGVHHQRREALAAFLREIPSIGLAGPPGVSGGGAGLPRPTPLIRLECFPVPRTAVTPTVVVDGVLLSFEDRIAPGEPPPTRVIGIEEYDGPTETVPLIAIAHGRSGDKGADVNIGIRARHPSLYPVLLRELTVDRVADYFAHLGADEVLRYELPGIHALNFVLRGGLGDGGTASLRFDPQGKALAQQFLDMEIDVPSQLATDR